MQPARDPRRRGVETDHKPDPLVSASRSVTARGGVYVAEIRPLLQPFCGPTRRARMADLPLGRDMLSRVRSRSHTFVCREDERRLRMRRPCAWRALSRPGLAVRGLGAIYLVAFTSLRRQVRGLYGARGILPARGYLAVVAAALPEAETRSKGRRRAVWAARLHAAPSLLWLDASDRGLGRLCTVGELAAGAMVLGVAGGCRRRSAGRRTCRSSPWGASSSVSSGTCCCSRPGLVGDARPSSPAADAAARFPAAARVGHREARLPRSHLA